ncbi:hypothetical protein [Stenotrophomonas maltophilia]|uniref:hypothetical protein n=1 Tax=Stenotrophomonas maltophilia TaxID=40324 RepID=UPI0016614775|nr:hypothetical protein [Stenotrophomonas maltophilia]
MQPQFALPVAGTVGDGYRDVLLASLTLEQLRLLLATLWLGSDEDLPSLRSRKDAEKQILATASLERIISAGLEVEARSAMKHCFVGQIRSIDGVETLAVAPQWSSFPFTKGEARIASIRDSDETLTVGLEHFVLSREWKQVDERTKQIEERYVRHPLIVEIQKRAGVISIRYPGVSAGNASKQEDRVSYESLVEGILRLIAERFAIAVSALHIKDAVQTLQLASSPRVRVVSAEVESSNGRVLLSTNDESNSVHEMLEEIIGDHKKLTREELQEISSSFIRRSSANVMLLFWVQERIMTRIKFWSHGAEFLIIWSGQDPALSLERRVIQLVVDMSFGVSKKEVVDAWTVIAECRLGGILTPRVLAERSGSKPEEASKALIEASRAALVEPVFRVKDLLGLDDVADRWTRDLASLIGNKRSSGIQVSIDSKDVEVGFRRIGGGAE